MPAVIHTEKLTKSCGESDNGCTRAKRSKERSRNTARAFISHVGEKIRYA